MLADEYHKRVVIVDTSNEIAGDGDIPHEGIGMARRMQVPKVDLQHKVALYPLKNIFIYLFIYSFFSVLLASGVSVDPPCFFLCLQVMIEAVENHMPQVIVIDEIGTELEANAAGTIAQRGVQLVGTAHGMTVENLIKNPSLQMLAGGIQVRTTLGFIFPCISFQNWYFEKLLALDRRGGGLSTPLKKMLTRGCWYACEIGGGQ